jgi:heat shock protein HtpX
LFLSKFMAKKTMGVHLIEQPQNSDEAWLLETWSSARRDAAGIRMPEVGIFEGGTERLRDWLEQATTHWSPSAPVCSQAMNHDEVEAVLAHEISHVANGDMVTLTLIQGVINTFVIFLSRMIGHFVDRVVFKVESGHGPAFWIVSLVTQFVLGILASR